MTHIFPSSLPVFTQVMGWGWRTTCLSVQSTIGRTCQAILSARAGLVVAGGSVSVASPCLRRPMALFPYGTSDWGQLSVCTPPAWWYGPCECLTCRQLIDLFLSAMQAQWTVVHEVSSYYRQVGCGNSVKYFPGSLMQSSSSCCSHQRAGSL